MAVGVRGYSLGSPLLWVDEAESAINGLTIVANGVPGDHFMGMPLFENTLVRPWPESPEYEFRDISYSDRGLAVYHGWLPLYAIAGAFRVAGVTPEDARRGTPPRDASASEMQRWTAVPRWPALVFSAVFVLAAYGLGTAVDGRPTGWALAIGAALSNVLVWYGRQARYYSATVAVGTACGLAVWNACRRGRLSDHALAGAAVGVLFHVHSVSAVAMACLYVAALPLARRQPRPWLRLLLAGLSGGLLILPWAAWSGLLGHVAHIPAARESVDLSLLLWSLPSRNPLVVGTAVAGLAWLGLALLPARAVDERWRRAILERRAGLVFALAWLLISYLAFVGLVPAASFFPDRLKLMVAVPGLLLNVLVIVAVIRMVRPSARTLPAVGTLTFLVLVGQVPPRLVPDAPSESFLDLVARIRSWDLGPDGRVLASPNEHLSLTYYSGRAVQSVAAVRREWLESNRGDVVVIEGPWFEGLNPAEIRHSLGPLGVTLDDAAIERLGEEAVRRATVADIVAHDVRVEPLIPAPSEPERRLEEAVREKTRVKMQQMTHATPLGLFHAPGDWREFRLDFFLWFAGPRRAPRAGLAFGACGASASAYVHRSGFVVFDCRPGGDPPQFPPEPELGDHSRDE